jgi:hypothetical protein
MTETPMAFKILNYPKLGMRLELGSIYTKAELEARCGKHHPERREQLHKKLADRALFKPVSLQCAMQRVKKTSVKKKAIQPHWVRPPVLLKGPGEKDEVGRRRLVADGIAAALLRDAEERETIIKDDSVLSVLRAWGFYLNSIRKNVIPQGDEGVFSDTLGLTRSRDARTLMSSLSRNYPNVSRLLMRWFRDHRPPSLDEDFPVTSISVNSKYAARRHRDRNNAGPSVIRAFGNFSGGNLLYWPKDTRQGGVEMLSKSDAQTLHVRTSAAIFDGRRAHEVTHFKGKERFSLVFFTVGKYDAASSEARELCDDLGFIFPNRASIERANAAVAR